MRGLTASDLEIDGGPNCWADPDARYIVEVRAPEAGECYLTHGKISVAKESLGRLRYPVIVGVLAKSEV